MSRLLTPEERAAFLADKPLKTPGVPPETNPEQTRVTLPASTICLSDRPRMASGWINSYEGHEWLATRAKAFEGMRTGGRMNFGFFPKKQKD